MGRSVVKKYREKLYSLLFCPIAWSWGGYICMMDLSCQVPVCSLVCGKLGNGDIAPGEKP